MLSSAAPPPLVVGYPRTGFSLLINVLAEILCHSETRKTPDSALMQLCDIEGRRIEDAIINVFRRRGLLDDLVYNQNFRQLVGGPKWIKHDAQDVACFRKYIGVRGKGDFTLITSHPRAVLEYYEVLHSHVSPSLWASHSGYSANKKFSCVRDPAGAIASACFSINALASEYVQRYFADSDDNDEIRQDLALYKLTDLNFFESLLAPYVSYLEEFATCSHRYAIMRWEDLILSPRQTVLSLASELGITIDRRCAAAIWQRLDHRNLTGAHKHNYREGHGIVGGWSKWLTNTHIDMIRDYGFDKHAINWGYGPISRIDESAYTHFQRRVDSAIKNNEILRVYRDTDLFGFAFNKSNIDFSRFSFKRYNWRDHTQIERSSCTDDALVMDVWDAAESACAAVNATIDAWCRRRSLPMPSNGRASPSSGMSWRPDCQSFTHQTRSHTSDADTPPIGHCAEKFSNEPILIVSIGTYNLIEFRGMYFALPQSLGEVDFHISDAASLQGVIVSRSLEELVARVPN